MTKLTRISILLVATLAGLLSRAAAAELLISEILFNPPGPDTAAEYIEIQGTPNSTVPKGTYLVSIAGNAGDNPGTIHNVFDLSSAHIGGNGFLVLFQQNTPYVPSPGSVALTNAGADPGWGDGSGSSIPHNGFSGLTELANPSVTFMLLQATNPPSPGRDLDDNDDGIAEDIAGEGWRILDSVGILGPDGAGDIAYGQINFRRSSPPGNAATAAGKIIPVGFTPRYVGRLGNSSGFTEADWVASGDLDGAAPLWFLSSSNTVPPTLAGKPLNHIGNANFGAPPLAGITLGVTALLPAVLEPAGPPLAYNLALNTQPTGPVTIQVSAPPALLISTDGAVTFTNQSPLVLSDTAPKTVLARAGPTVSLPSPLRFITNTVLTSSDFSHYPPGTLIPTVPVAISMPGLLLLNEIRINPPGTDGGWEYVEVRGSPGILLTNTWLLGLNGRGDQNPGRIDYALNLSGQRVGSNGLILIAGQLAAYSLAPQTTAISDPALTETNGKLGNDVFTLLLVSTDRSFAVGQDLDTCNNGVLDLFPGDAFVLDGLSWTSGRKNDRVYSAILNLPSGVPDAAERWPGSVVPCSPEQWFCGNLLGTNSSSLEFDPGQISINFPAGTRLTPGEFNNTAPQLVSPAPISGVIGDPSNPKVTFTVHDAESPITNLFFKLTSSNQLVVSDNGLSASITSPGTLEVSIQPSGVGYSDIRLSASDGQMTNDASFRYAASAPGRSNTIWHIGASDGSTFLTAGPGAFLIGDDENQVLRLYPDDRSSLPLRQFDFTAFLGLPDTESGLPREVDIEASTRVGNRLFWIGSHGHSAAGESRTNRTRIFITDLSGSGTNSSLTYVGRYDYLKSDLIFWDVNNLHGRGSNYFGLEASDAPGVIPKAPDGSGFAIEGLAMMPGNTNGAYIAFRAPIVPATNRTHALIVPLLNFAAVASGNGLPGSCNFGDPIELDLYGRGVRSIEGGQHGYVLIGGPPGANTGPYPQDFRLYTWSGQPGDKPAQHAADLHDLNPEGILDLPPTVLEQDTILRLLSDYGGVTLYGDGVPAKALKIQNFKKCRSDMVVPGPEVIPAPLITRFQLQNSSVTLQWRSLEGLTYRVLRASAPQELWLPVTGSITALGSFTEQTVAAGAEAGYYRVGVYGSR